MKVRALGVTTAALLAAGFSQMASAVPVQCSVSPAVGEQYMMADGVGSCLASGGNVSEGNNNIGSGSNDEFLNINVGPGEYFSLYSEVSDTDAGDPNPYGVSYSGGQWSFNSSFWSVYTGGAIGFKFGGNVDDWWFVYSLDSGISSGTYEYSAKQGLSHMVLYAGERRTQVPEPATLGLLGLGLLGVGFARRRRAAT